LGTTAGHPVAADPDRWRSERMMAMIDEAFLAEMGWDPDRLVLAPPVGHRLVVRPVCRVEGSSATAPLIADAFAFSHAADGSMPIRPDKVTGSFRRLGNRLGLKGVRLHDLRHFAATRMLAAGVPIRTVSGRLGHADASTTLGVYAHFVEASDQDAAAVMGLLVRRPVDED